MHINFMMEIIGNSPITLYCIPKSDKMRKTYFQLLYTDKPKICS